MNGFYFFHFKEKGVTRLIIYSILNDFEIEKLGIQIRSYCDRIIIPDEIIIITTEINKDIYETKIENHDFLSYLPQITRIRNTPQIVIQCFDKNGFVDYRGTELIKRNGLLNIFKKHDGIVESSASHHYIKPSGRHCNKFIRAGNVLVNGAEISFIAFCVLPFLNSVNYENIYCDTGAILSLAYAIEELKKIFNPEKNQSNITSFGSYEGLSKTKLVDIEKSIILISATTSRGLENEIREKYASLILKRIICLFSLNVDDNESPIVCRLDKKEGEELGYEPFISWSQSNCEECQKGSTPIDIVGDQFLPEGVELEPILITVNDIPKWFNQFSKKIVGKKLIIVNKPEEVDPIEGVFKREVFFDVESFLTLFDSTDDFKDYKKRFNSIIEAAIPITLKQIIHIDDPASEKIARYIKNKLVRDNTFNTNIELINASKLSAYLRDETFLEGGSLVIASASASGRSLISVSQHLRKIHKSEAYSYLICLVRTKDNSSYYELKSNLGFGTKPNDRYVNYLEKIELPLQGRSETTPWKLEKDFLKTLVPTGKEFDESNPIVKRLMKIDQGDEKSGLVNSLFWSSIEGEGLKLSAGFAFFDFEYDVNDISQADIYFTIKTIFHSLRKGKITGSKLLQNTHKRTVISPRNFDRFNDGIIQSAILRIARPSELDYSSDTDLSNEMLTFLQFLTENRNNESGEAFLEFLLAIGMKKLTLKGKDLATLYNHHLKEIEKKSPVKEIVRKIKELVDK